MRLRARHYATGELLDIECANGVIGRLGGPSAATPDLQAHWIAPGLFDLQINGCKGCSFNSPRLTSDEIRQVVDECRRHGITGLCPTLVTGPFAALAHGMASLRQACAEDPNLDRAMPGIHLEGPYISPEDGPRGAHPRAHVRQPDWDEFRRLQDAAGGRIRLVTLAPEMEGAMTFIDKLVTRGVVVALGHTGADAACIREAIAAGARLSTHLGNGSHAMLPRHDNYIWTQMAADELWASLICDGHHLPEAVVRCMTRVKTAARLILTCDSSSLAGLPPGRYRQWDQDFDIFPEGRIMVAGTSFLGGSWAFTDACIANLLRWTQTTLAEAVDMASARPRQLLGLSPHRLQIGDPADLVLFDWQPGDDFQVRATLMAGERVG